jgi:hypothetical protein
MQIFFVNNVSINS